MPRRDRPVDMWMAGPPTRELFAYLPRTFFHFGWVPRGAGARCPRGASAMGLLAVGAGGAVLARWAHQRPPVRPTNGAQGGPTVGLKARDKVPWCFRPRTDSA